MIENEQVEEIFLILEDKLDKTIGVLQDELPLCAQAAPIRTFSTRSRSRHTAARAPSISWAISPRWMQGALSSARGINPF